MSGNSQVRSIDLFAGTGAFTLALENTNKVKCVFANDMIKHSKSIYDVNFSHELTLGDLNTIDERDIPPFDILTGGFPCQPFSIAGHQRGFEDERANVFWKIMRILDHHQPRFVILENVRNLVSHDGGDTFEVIKNNLMERGYHITYKVLNTSKITGIPQNRERIYIVGIKNKLISDAFSLDFPEVPKRPITDFLVDAESVPDKQYYNDKSSTWSLLSEAVKKEGVIYQQRRVYVRENKSGECPTLTANMGGGGHNVPIIKDARGIRKLTPRECFNLQGFPQSYNLPELADCHLQKLVGNAVSVPVVKLIVKRLIELV